ncbi:MAG TPA: metallophosphoesterase [Bacilli bacterium]
MKIIVISDTHRNQEILQELARIHNDADYFLHAGDSCLPPSLIYPFLSVKGNCDFYQYQPHLIIKTPTFNIFMTHGHLYTKTSLIASAKLNDCKIAIFGHSHIPFYQNEDGIILLNPGSATNPRGNSKKSYAIIDENLAIEFKTIEEGLNGY